MDTNHFARATIWHFAATASAADNPMFQDGFWRF